jgi:NAD(P)-dependent dehydrogenase (short-subunit alcohol dehydrogenase family)
MTDDAGTTRGAGGDRVVAITGATGRLGGVVAASFADAGYRLALMAQSRADCENLAATLPGGLERHMGLGVDLSSAEASVAAASEVRDRLGPVSVLLQLVGGGTPFAAAPTPKHAAYAASKAAVEALTISVARDVAGTTATSNVVVIRSIGDEKPTDTRPDEIAAAMLWLCSPEAGATNGQRIVLHGRA